MTRERCLFVLPSLGGGGAERVVTTLLRHMNPNRFDLHLAVARDSGPNKHNIPDHVTVHDLAASRVVRSIVPLLRTIRRIRPHVVFSTILHMNLATALSRPWWPRGTRLVLRETNLVDHTLGIAGGTRAPTAARASTHFAHSLRRFGWRTLYRQANTIVCQTAFMRADLQHAFGLPTVQLSVIPNPVDFDAIQQAVTVRQGTIEQPDRNTQPSVFEIHRQLETPGPHVIALGRLRPVKGTDRLLAAFPRLLDRRPNAQLWLLGDGPCSGALRTQAKKLGIASHIHFAGYQPNPFAWLTAADLMAISSHAESSSNALLEAIACGCPPVAMQHSGGTQEILADLGLSDRFVPRIDAWEPRWFKRLPADSLHRVRQKYNVPKVVAQYERVLLDDTCGDRFET